MRFQSSQSRLTSPAQSLDSYHHPPLLQLNGILQGLTRQGLGKKEAVRRMLPSPIYLAIYC